MRKVLISLFFILQVIGIGYSRLSEERYFCWAPFDQISLYEIETKIGGHDLSPEEIRQRYKLPGKGRENRSIHHVFGLIRQYEEIYGEGEKVTVKVRYRTNGKAKEEWNFSTD